MQCWNREMRRGLRVGGGRVISVWRRGWDTVYYVESFSLSAVGGEGACLGGGEGCV